MDRNPVVYDKARYHLGEGFPEDLPDEQAFVHTGLYLGWIIDHGLYSDHFRDESGEMVARFKARQVTGPDVYDWWDGCLIDDMLSDEGNAFSRHYFDFQRGRFLQDYEELLCPGLPSLFHVPDTWESYGRLKPRLDQRHAEWRRSRERPAWRFWRR